MRIIESPVLSVTVEDLVTEEDKGGYNESPIYGGGKFWAYYFDPVKITVVTSEYGESIGSPKDVQEQLYEVTGASLNFR